jgi:hypothetical protein
MKNWTKNLQLKIVVQMQNILRTNYYFSLVCAIFKLVNLAFLWEEKWEEIVFY